MVTRVFVRCLDSKLEVGQVPCRQSLLIESLYIMSRSRTSNGLFRVSNQGGTCMVKMVLGV